MAELRFPTPLPADTTVRLRPWRDADVPAVLAAFRDPVLLRFWAGPLPGSETALRRHLAELERARQRGERIDLAFADPAEDRVVLGGGSLFDVDPQQGRAAVGYWLAPAARRRGVATHAVRLIARWAFAEAGVARLELTCGPDNRASQRVAERCGFTREALLRSHLPFRGGRRDTVVYGLLPGELR
jgi:RimJ/RimL family protein N-acetyltransferase